MRKIMLAALTAAVAFTLGAPALAAGATTPAAHPVKIAAAHAKPAAHQKVAKKAGKKAHKKATKRTKAKKAAKAAAPATTK